MEYECPNCGEPVDEDATVCPHCGSDEETGWNPDVEYYAVELPEDDDFDFSSAGYPAHGQSRPVAGIVLLCVALMALGWAGFTAYGWGVLILFLVLGACAAFFQAGTRRGH
ncbi:MAG: zinc ribbon domain-containing protein [Planctomycetota bacterium]